MVKIKLFFEIGLGIKYILLLSLRGGKKRLNHVLDQPCVMSPPKWWGQCSEAHRRCSVRDGWWVTWNHPFGFLCLCLCSLCPFSLEYLLLPPFPSSQLPPISPVPKVTSLSSRKSPFQGSLLQNTELNFSLTLRSCDTFNTEISKLQGTAGMGEHTVRSWSRYAWKCQESISHGLRVPDLSTRLFFILRQSLRCSCFDFRVFERVPQVQCVPKQGDFDEMFGRNLISVLSV